MFDMVSRIEVHDKLIGYRLTDRKEKIIVDVDQFEALVRSGLVYHVRYNERHNICRGFGGMNLETLPMEHFEKDMIHKHDEIIDLKHYVVQYKMSYLLEMLRFQFLDRVQIRYFANELLKIYNPEMIKTVMRLEKLTGKYNDETCTDIAPFLEKYNSKFNVLGYCIQNRSNKTITYKTFGTGKYKKIRPGQSVYINDKDYDLLCEKYHINQNNLLSRTDEVMLCVEHITKNVVLEEMSDTDRREILKDSKSKKIKMLLAEAVLSEENVDKYKVGIALW